MRFGLLVTLIVFATGCGTTRFSVSRRAPAEVDLPKGKVIAVAAIEGTEGDALVSELTTALFESHHFQVLERQHLKGAMTELKFSSDGHVSDETAMSFGSMIGASNLVVGQVQSADYKEEVNAFEQKCPGPNGTLRDCVRKTRVASAAMRVALRVLETESGKVLGAKNISATKQRSTEAIDANPPELGAREDMFRECRGDIVGGFVSAVAPHDVQVTVALRTDGNLPELETGNNYARIGNWSAAVEQYRAAVAKAAAMKPDQQAETYYNLGVGLGYSGSYDEGIAQVEKAYALDPDRLYLEQAGVIKTFKAEAARLRAQE